MDGPSTPIAYADTIEALRARILALIPAHPEITTLASVWDLFNVPGFDCSDLGPSLAQATEAWRAACRDHEATGAGTRDTP